MHDPNPFLNMPVFGTTQPTIQDTQVVLWTKIRETLDTAGLSAGQTGQPIFGTTVALVGDTKEVLMFKVLEKLLYG